MEESPKEENDPPAVVEVSSPPVPHSRSGVAAFFLTILSGVMILGVMLSSFVFKIIDGGDFPERHRQMSNIYGVIFFSALIADLIALTMAAVALMRGHNRLFPSLALIIGLVVFLFCFVGFII